jgi:adenine-specific DNA methylase
VSDEELPTTMPGGIHPPNYGIMKFGELFNSRQKLALISFLESVKSVYKKIIAENADQEYAKAVATYLGLVTDRVADKNANIVVWDNTRDMPAHVFSRQALPMIWDYAETNVFSGATGDWNSALDWVTRVIEHCSKTSSAAATVSQSSVLSLSYPGDYFDAVITDPPYYFSVTYADLSDFFYVWLKRSIGELYPDLFVTPLTPKKEEIIEGAFWDSVRYGEKNKAWFQEMLTRGFREIYRVLKSEGIACIVFAHKSTEAWETVINSLVDSGLYLTASWPIHTEMQSRLMAKESAALASSIYMVCRKRTKKETAYFNEIKSQIEQRIMEKLEQFWNEGIAGSDFFISAIGPAMEVFGKYESVEKLSGEKVSAKELLEYIRKVVSEYALSKILKSPQLGEIDADTRFYLLWRWTYNSAKIHFDDARKLAQAVGMEITEHWGNGFIQKDKEFISVLGAKERGGKFLEKGKFENMIDVLHACLLYWEQNKKKAISGILEETMNLNNNAFWQVAQAIAEVLPEGDKEKQMLQGFLYGKEGLIKEGVKAGKPKQMSFLGEE